MHFLICAVKILSHRAQVFASLPVPISAGSTANHIHEAASSLYHFCESFAIVRLAEKLERLYAAMESAQTPEQVADCGMALYEAHTCSAATELKQRLKRLHSLVQQLSTNPDLAIATNRSLTQVQNLFAAINNPVKESLNAEAVITEEADSILLGLEKLTAHYIIMEHPPDTGNGPQGHRNSN